MPSKSREALPLKEPHILFKVYNSLKLFPDIGNFFNEEIRNA
jgi:hypothetical protein